MQHAFNSCLRIILTLPRIHWRKARIRYEQIILSAYRPEKFSGIDYRSDQLTVRSPRCVYRMTLSMVLGLLVILWVNSCLSVIYFFTAPTGVLGLHKLDDQARYCTMANKVTLGSAVRLTAWNSIHCKKEACRNLISGALFVLEWNFEVCKKGKIHNQ